MGGHAFLIAATAALLGAAVPTPPASNYALTVPNPYTLSSTTIRRLTCRSPGEGGWGSSIRISDDLLLTARHVAQAKNGTWRGCELNGEIGKQIYVELNQDFVVLRMKMGQGYRAVISCDDIQEGARYYAVGYVDGEIVIEPLIGTADVIQGEAILLGKVYGGMSGGAVIDVLGRTVAMTVARDEKGRPYVYALPLKNTYLCKA